MGPLSGVRVVEFAAIGPGPFCGMLLADLGADVIRIDRPEPAFRLPLAPPFDIVGRGKRSIVLDLKTAPGRDCAIRLASRADAVIEGFRPGVMEKLGLGPEPLLAVNRRLVYGRMTGWGQDGPLAQRAGHDITYLAQVGALHAIGPPNGPPVMPLNIVGDYGGGALYLALGVVSALFHAARTGRGQVVDAAIVDGVSSLLAVVWGGLASGWWRDARGANLLDGGCPWYDVYETRDGQYVAVGPIEPQFFAALMEGLGWPPEMASRQWDVGQWPDLRLAMRETFGQRTRQEWVARFEHLDACVGAVLSFEEARNDRHVRARATLVDIDGVAQPGVAPRFSATPGEAGRRQPRPGDDTVAILEECGYETAQIDTLIASRAAFIS